MHDEQAVEELTREQLMRRVNFDRRALQALAEVYEIERSGGSGLIRYCRCCGWRVRVNAAGPLKDGGHARAG